MPGVGWQGDSEGATCRCTAVHAMSTFLSQVLQGLTVCKADLAHLPSCWTFLFSSPSRRLSSLL